MTFEKVCLFVQNKLSSIQIDAVSIGPQNWAIPLINRNNITHNKANNYTLKSFRIYHKRDGTDRLVQKWIASTIHLYFGKWLFIIHNFFSIFSWNYALSNEGILNGYGLWAVLVSKRMWILIYDFHRLILLRID